MGIICFNFITTHTEPRRESSSDAKWLWKSFISSLNANIILSCFKSFNSELFLRIWIRWFPSTHTRRSTSSAIDLKFAFLLYCQIWDAQSTTPETNRNNERERGDEEEGIKLSLSLFIHNKCVSFTRIEARMISWQKENLEWVSACWLAYFFLFFSFGDYKWESISFFFFFSGFAPNKFFCLIELELLRLFFFSSSSRHYDQRRPKLSREESFN